MKKLLVAFIALSLFASLAFGKWVFKDAVIVGWPEATDGGYDKINCKGFKNPYSVTVDPDGKIWCAAYYPRYWYQMDENGNYVLDPLGKKVQVFPDDITIQKAGKDTSIRIYPIFILRQDGKYDSLKFLPLPDGSVDTLRVGGGRGMDRDPQGNIIVAQFNAVYKIDYKTYAVLNKLQLSAAAARPAVDSSGYVFVKTQVGGSVVILDPDNFTIYNQIPDIPFDSRGLTVSPDGKNVYLSTYSAGGGVRHYYSADGVDGTYALVDTLIASVGATHFVQWDPAGLLWAASVEESARRIMWAMDPNQDYAVVDSTSFTWFADNKADTTHPAPPLRGYAQPWHLRAPRDAAFSADGKTMYIADMYSYVIKAYEKEEAGVNPVTFKVNMSIQEAIGNFNPATDTVVVRGSFNSWGGAADRLFEGSTPKVYELTKNFSAADVGTQFFYKFVILKGSAVWERDPNRDFTLQAGGQVLDEDFFDRVATIGATANITWQADMSDMLQNNWFNPGTDQLRVTGGMNGWGDLEDWATAQDLIDPSLFLLTKSLTYDAGTELKWKFRAFPHESFLDSGWEGGSDHVFVFSGTDMTLDKLKPAILPAGKDLTKDVTVRFTVNCNPPYNLDYFNKKPFPTVNGVYLNGDFVPLGAGGWGGWTVADTVGGGLIKMYDDGATKGDAVAGDNIWTTEVLFATGSSNTHYYKYGLYSKGYTDTLNTGNIPMDNEAGFSMNHTLVISDAAPVYVAPTNNFGSQWNTAVERIPSSTMPVEFVLQQNYPNPFNPTTEITYAIPEKTHVSLTVYNTVGQLIKRLMDGEQIAGSYRAAWDGTDEQGTTVPSGVYFYRLQTASFAKTMKMTLMK